MDTKQLAQDDFEGAYIKGFWRQGFHSLLKS
jgi:hypothetical protein